MILCINCNENIVKMLDELIADQQYNDYSETISMAVKNLSVLHKEIGKGEALFTSPSKKSELAGPTIGETSSIPEIFSWHDKKESFSPIAVMPSKQKRSNENITLDNWLFGQYNKILPLKASCRALASLLKTHPQGISVNEINEMIGTQIIALGDYLLAKDKKFKRIRDNAIATAFPRSGEDSRKSLLRYISQFIASVNSKKELSGLPYDYRLINYIEGNEKIGLTEVGWIFAAIFNPVLDGQLEGSENKFSSEEIVFLLEHISKNVIIENFAFKTILTEVKNGEKTPEKLDIKLQIFFTKDKRSSLSKSFLSSQRSGAVSRMVDLDLLYRKRNGQRVSYFLSTRGEQFLANS